MTSKYKARHTVIDGINFDSKLESDYYIYLKERQQRGEIQDFNLQPVFVLQEGFKKNGKSFRPITYVADFEVLHNDDSIEIVDVKGMLTKDFQIKRKLFEKKYPYTLNLVTYVKKWGGWITLEELNKRRKVKK